MSEVHDFGYAPADPILFKIQGQDYTAKARIGAQVFLDLVTSSSGKVIRPEAVHVNAARQSRKTQSQVSRSTLACVTWLASRALTRES